MKKIKFIKRQDSGFKLSYGNSGETSLNLSNEIFDFISQGTLNPGEERDVTFRIYKEDCIKAMSFVIMKLPLYKSSSNYSNRVDNYLDIFGELYSKIESYFGTNIVAEYKVCLFYRPDGRIYLKGLRVNGFSIRDYLVENYSALQFDNEGDGMLNLHVLSDIEDNGELEEEDAVGSEDILTNSLQQIIYGAPGTGKSHEVKKQTGEFSADNEDRDLPNVFRTTFHPDTDYASFVGCYKPSMRKTGKKHQVDGKDVDDEEIIYEFVPQTFTDAYVYAYKNPTEQTYLVIEEINRGNCAQIFGDLFQLLDRKNGVSEYKIKADKDLAKFLNEELGKDADGIKDGKLCLPANLNILATMNTSDQSLFPIDSAFKRRWDWKYIPIKEGKEKWSVVAGEMEYDWWTFADRMNSVVGEATSSEDKKMGFYFCRAEDKKIDVDKFVSKVLFYLWNDVFKDNGLDWLYDGNPVFKYKDENDREIEMTFSTFFNNDGTAVVEQVQRLMKNLKIEGTPVGEENDNNAEDDIDEEGQSGVNKFALNGKQMTLRDISKNVVLDYAQNNPSLSAQEIKDYFRDTFKGIGVAHIVETEAEYQSRDGQKSQKRSASEIIIPTGEKLYVTTQWNAKNESDNFFNFLEIVNREGLGTITKVS